VLRLVLTLLLRELHLLSKPVVGSDVLKLLLVVLLLATDVNSRRGSVTRSEERREVTCCVNRKVLRGMSSTTMAGTSSSGSWAGRRQQQEWLRILLARRSAPGWAARLMIGRSKLRKSFFPQLWAVTLTRCEIRARRGGETQRPETSESRRMPRRSAPRTNASRIESRNPARKVQVR
jgi:hypothetical protein